MARIIFYEKPGCIGNARQKALLTRSGHDLDIRNMLTTAWTAGTLRPFFGDRPVAEWFNTTAPRVKSGEVDPATLAEADALNLMIADPILIRRPLMQADNWLSSGFRQDEVHDQVGLVLPEVEVTDTCPRIA